MRGLRSLILGHAGAACVSALCASCGARDLSSGLQAASEDAVIQATWELGLRGTAAAPEWEGLLDNAGHGSMAVRLHSAWALGQSVPPEAAATPRARAALRVLLHDGAAPVRAQACWSLRAALAEDAALRAEVAALGDDADPWVRWVAEQVSRGQEPRTPR